MYYLFFCCNFVQQLETTVFLLPRPTLRGEFREDNMTAQNFEVVFVGAYSGTTQFITPTKEGFNWGSSVRQNGTILVPFVLANKDLEVIAFGNTREESHNYFPELYFEPLDGSGESTEVWGAYEICSKERKSYSDEYYASQDSDYLQLIEGNYVPIKNGSIVKENTVLSNARVVESDGIWNIVSYHSDFTQKIPSRRSDEVIIHSFDFPVKIQVTQHGSCESHSRGIIYKVND